MPYLITCPNCSAKLKSAQPVPAGRALNCPQCKTAFTLSEPAPEIEVAAPAKEVPKPATAEAPKAPTPVTPAPQAAAKPSRPQSSVPDDVSPRKGRKARDEIIPEAEIVDAADFTMKIKPKRSRDDDDDDRQRSRRRDEDDDDRPRAKRRDADEVDDRPRSRRQDEDEDDRPRSKRHDDDEDDRPRSRRKAEDEDDRPANKRRNDDDRPRPKGPADDFAFDDDDKPKARRSRNDDDKDRPRARKSRAEEDDLDSEDDAPRSRARYKKGKKRNRTLLIALLGGGAALLLVLFLVGFFLLDPFGLLGGGGAPSEMLAWAPADTEAIVVLDVVEGRQIDQYKDRVEGNVDAARYGIRPDEVATMMLTSRSGMGGKDVVVYKLISSADQSKIIAAVNGKEVTVNGKKYYRTGTNGGLYFPSSRLVVVTQGENTMQTLLQKSESSIIVSEEMRSAAKRGSGTIVMASVGKTAEGSDLIGLWATQGGMFGPGAIGGKPVIRSATARSFVSSVKVSGDRATLTLVSTYDSSETARRISDDLRKNMDQNPTIRGEIDSYDVSQSGSAVTLTLRESAKGKKTFMPFGDR